MIICIPHIDWTLLATFLTALATFWTVWEVKKQREQSNMPNLVLSADKRFYLYRALSGNDYMYWHENSLQDVKLTEGAAYRTFYLDLFNIGVGSAKEVIFNYKINVNEMLTFLNSLGTISEAKLDLGKDALNFSGKFGIANLGMNAGVSDIFYSHVFVPKSDEKPFKISLPMIYLYIFNAFLLSLLTIDKNGTLFNKFPSIILTTTYKDIANKPYSKTFKIGINIQSMTINTDRAPSHISGIFKIEEQN